MNSRFGHCRTSSGQLPGFLPPFDGLIDETRLGEVMSQQFWFGRGGADQIVAQCLSDAAVQNLAPALKQVLISRILNERMLKAVFGFRRKALHQEYVGLSQPFQRRLQRCVVHSGYSAKERVGE